MHTSLGARRRTGADGGTCKLAKGRTWGLRVQGLGVKVQDKDLEETSLRKSSWHIWENREGLSMTGILTESPFEGVGRLEWGGWKNRVVSSTHKRLRVSRRGCSCGKPRFDAFLGPSHRAQHA